MKILRLTLFKFRLRQCFSAVCHGGIFRIFSVFIERMVNGYSTRSLTYSWPKKLFLDQSATNKMRHYIIPHLEEKFSFAGLKSILEFIGKDIENGKNVQIILHDFGGALENFPKILGWNNEKWKLLKDKLFLKDFSLTGKINLKVSPEDEYVATAWWTKATIDQSKPSLPKDKVEYIIQDFEALFYSPKDTVENERINLAKKTYLKFGKAKINSKFLSDYLSQEGYFGKSINNSQIEVFEPLIDLVKFKALPNKKKKKQIFVYARPEVRRNRFDLCVAALVGALPNIPSDWEIIGLGTLKKNWPLSKGRYIQAIPKLDFESYIKFLQETPLSLCLMESPHPSHPPLEHAACGGIVVCNKFSNKDYSQLGSQFKCVNLEPNELAAALVSSIKSIS